jgi:riboflavin synthase
MFTGLIEEIGKIRTIRRRNHFWDVEISAKTVLEGTQLGDSICVDGSCLSVTKFGKSSFSVDISEETLKRAKAKNYHVGQMVNLERALKVGDRLGGHLVQGHVEGVGNVTKFRKRHGTSILEILLPKHLTEGILEKGFIAIDGISLTISKKFGRKIEIAVINDTIKRTNLSYLRAGDKVNIERDFMILAKI